VTIQVGSVLCGRYGLEASIGKGGMGEVFCSSNLETGERVAIKVVNRGILGELLVQRLYREALAASRIQSAYIPRLIEVAQDEDGEMFLVMELLFGETLSERLRRTGGFLTWDEVRRIGEEVLLGIIDAHAAGVVHRDLKPGNIFLDSRPNEPERAMILDFGVCKLDSQDMEHLTTTGEALGTVAYMAPEQIRGASKVDERADIYSFAMVVFEALSGRLAHDASGQMAMIASKLERSARALKDLAQVPVPPGLDSLVARALARNPADRFPNAHELLKAWRSLGPATVMPRVLPIHSGVPIIHHTQTAMTAGTFTRAAGSKNSKLGLILASVALIGATALLVFVLFGKPHTSRAAAPPAEPPEPATPAAAASVDDAVPVNDLPVAADPSDPAAVADPLDDVAPDAGPSARVTRPRVRRVYNPNRGGQPRKPSGSPHIQEQPRY
jgi:serine/threonine-protein kinase